MFLHVLFKLLLGVELAWAARALVVLLVGVAFEVDLEVSFFGEGLTADVALEWLDALVFSNVDLKSRFLRVTFGAVGTFVRLFVEVIVQVSLEVALGDEGLSAVVKGAFVRSFLSL